MASSFSSMVAPAVLCISDGSQSTPAPQSGGLRPSDSFSLSRRHPLLLTRVEFLPRFIKKSLFKHPLEAKLLAHTVIFLELQTTPSWLGDNDEKQSPESCKVIILFHKYLLTLIKCSRLHRMFCFPFEKTSNM